MNSSGALVLIIIGANVLMSLAAFNNRVFLDRYIFHVWKIISYREYIRILSSGFLHANIGHLFFNMFALYSFSYAVEASLGVGVYLVIYLGSLLAGNLLALFIHRKHPNYRALGASGAVSGIIFASILIYPHSSISFIFLPIAIPSWLFGIGFVLISIFGIRSQYGNIGHEAHLGGAVAGIILLILLKPQVASAHPVIAASILLPSIIFIVASIMGFGSASSSKL
jgi:membrane associated rhomboid family serine protease